MPDEAEEGDHGDAFEAKGPAPFPGGLSPRALWDLKRVLIIKVSHVGQHKFAGNVIVSRWLSNYFPSSASSGHGAFFLPRLHPHLGGDESPFASPLKLGRRLLRATEIGPTPALDIPCLSSTVRKSFQRLICPLCRSILPRGSRSGTVVSLHTR